MYLIEKPSIQIDSRVTFGPNFTFKSYDSLNDKWDPKDVSHITLIEKTSGPPKPSYGKYYEFYTIDELKVIAKNNCIDITDLEKFKFKKKELISRIEKSSQLLAQEDPRNLSRSIARRLSKEQIDRLLSGEVLIFPTSIGEMRFSWYQDENNEDDREVKIHNSYIQENNKEDNVEAETDEDHVQYKKKDYKELEIGELQVPEEISLVIRYGYLWEIKVKNPQFKFPGSYKNFFIEKRDIEEMVRTLKSQGRSFPVYEPSSIRNENEEKEEKEDPPEEIQQGKQVEESLQNKRELEDDEFQPNKHQRIFENKSECN